jgi:hypothetical protein
MFVVGFFSPTISSPRHFDDPLRMRKKADCSAALQ